MEAAARFELRTDVLTGRQVIVAPIRSDRPQAILRDPPLTRGVDPFAEGHESETPGEHFANRLAETLPNAPGWSLRVVPNRYPFVSSTATATPENDMLFPVEPAIGAHDVVIECPDGRSRLLELSCDELTAVLTAWQRRLRQLAGAGELQSVCVFRNEGFSAGASLMHCHSQIIATRQLLESDVVRQGREERHREHHGRGLADDLLSAERSAGTRIVAQTRHVVVLCPFASRASWHVRLSPNGDAPFQDAAQVVLRDVADNLLKSLVALKSAMGTSFSFNLLLQQPPLNQPNAWPWMLDIIPRTGRIAGWELMTGIDVVSVAPERAAELLRVSWAAS